MGADGILRLESVTVAFGGVVALRDVTLSVAAGRVHGLIGPNGAGKTTLFNAVTGFCPVAAGRITLFDRDLTGAEPHRLAWSGLARTFQNIRLFRDLSIMDNLLAASHLTTAQKFHDPILFTANYRATERRARERAEAALAYVGLDAPPDRAAGSLPYGRQRALEIARALMLEPRILLLDEPAAGMNAREGEELARLIRKIGGGGVAVLIIEHDMKVLMGVSDRVTVLNHGERIAEGAPAEIRADPLVVEAYLGKAAG